MFVIVSVYDRDITYMGCTDTKEEAQEIIYEDLLGLYDDNKEMLAEDIESGNADYDASRMLAWSNRKGNYDLKAFWV